ncbi:hypothetical protein JEQ12_018227 [Ovis aries]|uniref:Uncharacterized protein n=1 Tax=Ovis aries TaxID=9940 RepID=A0A836A0M7_SHEEP|nr:hypothetical protein JEQ12_018227 [Ovis aries]
MPPGMTARPLRFLRSSARPHTFLHLVLLRVVSIDRNSDHSRDHTRIPSLSKSGNVLRLLGTSIPIERET